jgi:hypothetical protein
LIFCGVPGQAQHRDFGARAREVLRGAVARCGSVGAARVSIEGVQQLVQKSGPAGISVRLSADVGADLLAADSLVKSLKVSVCLVVCILDTN